MSRAQPSPYSPGGFCPLPAPWAVSLPFCPLQYGLYSSFMGCFVYCLLGTAKDVTLGPTAIMSLLVSSYTFHQPGYAVLLAFLSGCIQLAMGLLHLGERLLPCTDVCLYSLWLFLPPLCSLGQLPVHTLGSGVCSLPPIPCRIPPGFHFLPCH